MTFRKKKLIYLNVMYGIAFTCGVIFVLIGSFLHGNQTLETMMSSTGMLMISASLGFWGLETKYWLKTKEGEV